MAEVGGAPHCDHFGGNAILHFVGELLVLLLRDDVLATNVKQQSAVLHFLLLLCCCCLLRLLPSNCAVNTKYQVVV